jgi:hypothetical protein
MFQDTDADSVWDPDETEIEDWAFSLTHPDESAIARFTLGTLPVSFRIYYV